MKHLSTSRARLVLRKQEEVFIHVRSRPIKVRSAVKDHREGGLVLPLLDRGVVRVGPVQGDGKGGQAQYHVLGELDNGADLEGGLADQSARCRMLEVSPGTLRWREDSHAGHFGL